MSEEEWNSKVYAPSLARTISADVRKAVKERDHNHCQVTVCRSKKHLTCHHIIPDREGGLAIEDNLLLLCEKCHDELEESNIRNRVDIMRYIPIWYAAEHSSELEKPVLVQSDDWHTWVYGGARNPNI